MQRRGGVIHTTDLAVHDQVFVFQRLLRLDTAYGPPNPGGLGCLPLMAREKCQLCDEVPVKMLNWMRNWETKGFVLLLLHMLGSMWQDSCMV